MIKVNSGVIAFLLAIIVTITFTVAGVCYFISPAPKNNNGAFTNDNLTSANAVFVNDLFQSNGRLNSENVAQLFTYIGGYDNLNYNDSYITNLSAYTADITDSTKVSSTGVGDRRRYHTVVDNEDVYKTIVVTICGLKWELVWLTTADYYDINDANLAKVDKDGDGEVDKIACFWLADSKQSEWAYSGTSPIASYPGTTLSTDGLLTSKWNLWYDSDTDNTSRAYPSDMYGTSYIRAVTLNNGGSYATGTDNGICNDTLTEFQQDANNPFAKFTMSSVAGNITDYIVQPKNNTFSRVERARIVLQWNSDPTNESITGANATYDTRKLKDYRDRENYSVWQNDNLWIPSITEAGFGTGVRQFGYWQTTTEERTTNTASGDASKTWLRSARDNQTNQSHYIMPSGYNSTNTSEKVSNLRSVRPCFFLNLSMLNKGDGATISTSVSNSNAGSVTASGYIDTTGTNQYFCDFDSSVTLTATVNNGYKFGYWLKDGATFTGNTTNPLTITANDDAEYLAVFYSEDLKFGVQDLSDTVATMIETQGSNITNIAGSVQVLGYTKFNGLDAINVSATPAVGFEFVGWKINGSNTLSSKYTDDAVCILLTDIPDIKLVVAVFRPLSEVAYSVTFTNYYDNPIYNQFVAAGSKAVEPSTPARSGYTFNGWFNGSNEWDFDTDLVNGNITLRASWTAEGNATQTLSYAGNSVTYDANGGTIETAEYNKFISTGSEYSRLGLGGLYTTMPTPTREGYSFAGWYTDANGTTRVSAGNSVPTSSTTLYAIWASNSLLTGNYSVFNSGDIKGNYSSLSSAITAINSLSNSSVLFVNSDQAITTATSFQISGTSLDVTIMSPDPSDISTITVTFSANNTSTSYGTTCGFLAVNSGCNLTLENIQISGVSPTTDGHYGRGIFAYGPSTSQSKLNINAGTILSNFNTNSLRGGAVEVKAEFNMTGGIIANNKADYGAGICSAYDSNAYSYQQVKMTGGKICGNAALNNSFKRGGGMFIQCKFYMYGGEICYNTAPTHGAGVCMETGILPYLYTGASIHHNVNAGSDNGAGFYWNGSNGGTYGIYTDDVLNNQTSSCVYDNYKSSSITVNGLYDYSVTATENEANCYCSFYWGCFTGETLVWVDNNTENGSFKRIDEIQVGDMVYTYNENTNTIETKEVIETHQAMSRENKIVHVKVTGQQSTINTTIEHPFYTTTNGWVGAQHLQAGNIIKTASGEAVVESVEIENASIPVYNLTTKDNHTYFITHDQLLVHNVS